MNQIKIELKIPKYLWQCLVVMASEDYRTEADFLLWLLLCEAEKREMIFRRELCKK